MTKLNKTLHYLTFLLIPSTIVFSQASNINLDSKLNIVTENSLEISLKENNLKLNETGRGIPISAAYLTPGKHFGYMYIDKHDYKDNGIVKTYIDELNTDSKWSYNTEEYISSASNALYSKAKKYFTEKDSPIQKSILNLNTNTLNKGLYNIQKSDDGREFVASTLYLRYIYDVDDSDIRENIYESSSPILNNSYINGPYIGIGDCFDTNIDTIKLGKKGKELIQSNKEMYFTSLSSLGIIVPINDVIGLTKDKDYNRSHSQEYNENNKAMLEKRFEYRRYISNSQEKDFTNFEIVYPVTITTLK